MSHVYYAKVVIIHGTFEDYRQQLVQLAGPGMDVGVLQVGVHEALLRPHLLRQIRSRQPAVPVEQLLREAGANRIDWIREDAAQTLYLQRIVEDLDPQIEIAVPDLAGGRAWHLQAVNVAPAWAALGGPDTINWGTLCVGQLDTGYTRHKALGHGQPGGTWLLTDQCRTIMDSDLPPGYAPDLVQPDDGVDPMSPSALFRGHGTRVGSTISGHAVLDDGFTFRGIAPKVPHAVVRITDSVAINDRQNEFAQGLRYLVDVVGVDVINVSLGVFPPVASPAMKRAVAHAHAQGVIVVCAAGNHVDPVVAPARLPETIAVAGVTWQSLPWYGSSFGPEVDFSAPAANLYRPEPVPQGIGTQFKGMGDGTSYAAAITTGSAALWLCRWGPEIAAKYGRTGARVEAFRQAAIASCRKPPGWYPTPFGAGILDTGRLCTDPSLALP
ncbi:MAG: S8/S53 family peptidase [Rhodoferax sp.]|uniref:S8/S53 family peptidase n=1 Tax=Rhodoferax sp. TaxID=50421 RepID=UPI002728C47B|nr:S8/S53 family peptidase [Rhodoferax sp.]MDO8448997.1 S8/S53 family peptidase [Rhodoferax sp.]